MVNPLFECFRLLAFFQTRIVPDVVDEVPNHIAEISWPGNVSASLGNTLTPTQVKDIPTVNLPNANSSVFYTLFFVDPDAPSVTDSSERNFMHWLVVNIPGNRVSEGVTLIAYIGSGPSQGSGFHRYTFVVFKQPEKMVFPELFISNTTFAGRPSFSVKDFADRYNLRGPIYGNFYQATYDDYVPIISAQLGF